MKVCIVGAGAIGGFIGTRLALAGRAQVSAIARGATLAALREHGWRLQQGAELVRSSARAVERASELGVQDLVVIAVKGQSLTAVAQTIAPLLDPETMVLPAMNGVPWWFGRGVAALEGAPLECVDPGGVVSRSIPFEQVLGCVVHAGFGLGPIHQGLPIHHVVGCVVHAGCASPEPGLVLHKMGQGLIVGEPAGGQSDRVQRVADLLAHAGFDVTHSSRVRYDIWYKLWGNLTMNPVSAITGATMDRMLGDPLVRAFCSAAMREAAAIGALIGCAIEQSPEDRHAITAKLGAIKTSMLQDVEAGRAIELDAIVAAVQEIGQRLRIATPNIDALLGLTRLFARTHGLYPDAP